ncbi:MAG TPA: hypothetical protein PK539_04555 [Candidatus Paceibacterota bacterium]|nr:hypothetical protein [Candidatus Paceibacterota bacterium]
MSHHIRIVKNAGLFASERMGTGIRYKLFRDSFVGNLEKVIWWWGA